MISGDHSNEVDAAEESRRVIGFIVHPEYDHLTNFANDIALVVLAEDITFDDEVGSIKLPETEDSDMLEEGATVTVSISHEFTSVFIYAPSMQF